MPRPFHSSRFNHPHNSGWGVQIIKLIIMKFSPPFIDPKELKYASVSFSVIPCKFKLSVHLILQTCQKCYCRSVSNRRPINAISLTVW
jgi:hypothetical protein